MDRSFKGRAKRLDDIDLPRIGARIGVGEDEIHAFMDVESAGSGFDSQGRPKMLFEPHVFYRNLSGAKRDKAVRAGIAYAKWRRNYPKDSYPRLLSAMDIDETAALKAASWGLGQILGENYAAVKYASPQAMVTAFMDDEENHVQAIVDFLISKNLAKKLKAHDWAGVARGYNGAGYKQNAYDTKMAAAFAKWSRIKDTPFSPGAPQKPADAPKPSEGKISSSNGTNDPAVFTPNISTKSGMDAIRDGLAPSPKPEAQPAAKPVAGKGLAVLFAALIASVVWFWHAIINFVHSIF